MGLGLGLVVGLNFKSRIVIEIKLSLLPSPDNPVYYNKAAKLLKMIGIQPKQAVKTIKISQSIMATPMSCMNEYQA